MKGRGKQGPGGPSLVRPWRARTPKAPASLEEAEKEVGRGRGCPSLRRSGKENPWFRGNSDQRAERRLNRKGKGRGRPSLAELRRARKPQTPANLGKVEK